MNADRFRDYIRRFNAQDPTTFEDYLTNDVIILNGTLELRGIQGMKDHYARIWQTYQEQVNCLRVVMDDESLAVQMWTHFVALRNDADSVLGPVQEGECFDFHGVVMYRIRGGKFCEIRVAYNDFTHTDLAGEVVHRGIPH